MEAEKANSKALEERGKGWPAVTKLQLKTRHPGLLSHSTQNTAVVTISKTTILRKLSLQKHDKCLKIHITPCVHTLDIMVILICTTFMFYVMVRKKNYKSACLKR